MAAQKDIAFVNLDALNVAETIQQLRAKKTEPPKPQVYFATVSILQIQILRKKYPALRPRTEQQRHQRTYSALETTLVFK